MTTKKYELNMGKQDPYLMDVFNDIITCKCNICYIGLDNEKKDKYLEEILTHHNEPIVITSHFESNSNAVINAYTNPDTVIFNLIADNEQSAIDILISRVMFKESINSHKAKEIVFGAVDYIVTYDYTKDCISKISKVDAINQTITPIVKYDKVTSELI